MTARHQWAGLALAVILAALAACRAGVPNGHLA
jgi:hypothetical protein